MTYVNKLYTPTSYKILIGSIFLLKIDILRKIKSDINILLKALVIVVFINNTSDDDDTNIGMNLLNRSKVIMIKLLIFY